MTISESTSWSYQKLKDVESYQSVTQKLLAHSIHQPITYLWAHPDTEISAQDQSKFTEMVDRAAQGEPLSYILGYADFYDLRFQVDPRVLIPRPETEALVELVIKYVQDSRFKIRDSTVIDVGTGSGCIALTLAKHLPSAHVYAIDISPEALEVARTNARLLDIPNVTFLQGSLLQPLAALQMPPVDVIVANLPYISDQEYPTLDRNVRDFEPALALKSGDTPDKLNHQLAAQVPHLLKPGGLFAYETTNGQIIVDFR